MHFSSGKLLAVATAMTGFTAATPVAHHARGSNVIIGYRVVSADQATAYNNAGTIPDPGATAGGSAQIGYGTYTTAGRDDWPMAPQDPWYCIIYADSDALDRVSKAWVPKSHWNFEGDLWYNQGQIDSYIKFLESSWDPAKTIRLGLVDGIDGITQLLIPRALHNDQGGAMGISVRCVAAADKDSLGTYTVNYDDWPNNIKGSRTPPDPPVVPIGV